MRDDGKSLLERFQKHMYVWFVSHDYTPKSILQDGHVGLATSYDYRECLRGHLWGSRRAWGGVYLTMEHS